MASSSSSSSTRLRYSVGQHRSAAAAAGNEEGIGGGAEILLANIRLAERRARLFDIVHAVYLGDLDIDDIPENHSAVYGTIIRNDILDYVALLADDLEDSVLCKTLSRALIKLVYPEEDRPELKRHLYTDYELRMALWLHISDSIGSTELLEKYDVTERTLRKRSLRVRELIMELHSTTFTSPLQDIHDLRNYFNESTANSVEVRTIVFCHTEVGRQQLGTSRLLAPEEQIILSLIAGAEAKAANGASRRVLCAKMRSYLQRKVEMMDVVENEGKDEGKEAEGMNRLGKAAMGGITNKTALKNFVDDVHIPGKSGIFVKPSSICSKRILANNPVLHDQFKTTVIQEMSQLFVDDLIDGPPKAGRVGNADEVGLPEDGSTHSIYYLRDDLSEGSLRHFRNVQNEKSSYWTTLMLLSIADGSVMDPMVIRDSKDDTYMSADKFMNLGPNFIVYTTPSAYNNHEAMGKWTDEAISFTKSTKLNPFFLFMDGHDSHFSYETLKKCFEAGFYIIFLRSNASITDQVGNHDI